MAKPGGWVELVELNTDQSVLGTSTTAREFFDLLEQIWELKGMGGNFGQDLKRWMEEAGLEDVQETLLRNKVGVKAGPGKVESSINGALGAGPMVSHRSPYHNRKEDADQFVHSTQIVAMARSE
jgi:hypothetical protein